MKVYIDSYGCTFNKADGQIMAGVLNENNITKDIVRQKKYLSMAEDLKAGKVDLIIMDELPGKKIVENNENLIILDGFVFEDNYAIAVKKGNALLLNKINEVMVEQYSEKEKNR